MAPDRDDLDDLQARLRATQEAAERIADGIPAQGWASARERDETAGEVQALVAILRALRDLVPEELVEQVHEILRQLLLLLRAILDLVVERLGAERGAADRRGRAPRAEVQDIPIT
jgi:hypothetical protein